MTCPYCLQPKPRTPSASTREEDIDAEIEHVEDLISRLFTERSKLRKKKNEMQSAIYSLPTEILALIFEFVCPPPPDFLRRYGLGRSGTRKVTYPHIIGVLSATSAQWRSVVLSTPTLWASFIADARDLRLMQTVFARSGDLPVSASLSMPNSTASYQSAILGPVLQEHAARIRMLHMRHASTTWINQHIPLCFHLKYLCLQNEGFRDEPLLVDNPCAYLTLRGFRCQISLSWSKIRVLHLINIPADLSLELLEKCTNLIEFRLRFFTGLVAKGVQLPSSPFTLPCLELFEWPLCHDSAADHAMLQYTRMPALQTFVCSGSFDGPSDALSIFFKHLPSTLATVRIDENTISSGSSMFSYFLTLSGVKHLILHDRSLSLSYVFRKLARKTHMFENREMPVLPKLQSIYFRDSADYIDQEDVLRIFRRSRPQLPGSLPESSFRLELGSSKVNWRPEIKEELRKMVERGHKVELWECTKPVDWLPT